MIRTTFVSLALIALCAAASAAPKSYDLPEDTAQLRPPVGGTEAGHAAAQANCLTCHSPDYIAMQPPKKGQAFWSMEVTKMIKAYGAPIEERDAREIADYLAATY